MGNVNKQVWDLLSRDVSLQKSIARGLTNTRAVARFLIDTHKIDASLDAVISAIRRYESESDFIKKAPVLREVFKSSMVFTKDHVCAITIKTRALRKFVDELKEETQISRNFRLVKSKKLSKIFIELDEKDAVLKRFSDEEVIYVKEPLGELRVVLQKDEQEDIQGVLARLTSEIAVNDISISELIMCYPEILVYVNRADLLKAHQAILALQEL